MHELKQLVHHRLEELPVGLQEPRVLSDNIHDIASHDGLVILATLHFGKSQKIFDNGH